MRFILWGLLILGLAFSLLFVIAVLNDYLVYRDLRRRLRVEGKGEGEVGESGLVRIGEARTW